MSVLTLEDVVIEAATELAISGECDLPIDNKWGGVDLVVPGYYDSVPYARGLIFTNGVRFAVEDDTLHIYKFEKHGLAAQVSIKGKVSSSVLVAIAKEWLA
jgi:hypothetical protein